jgi:hypothetical protein
MHAAISRSSCRDSACQPNGSATARDRQLDQRRGRQVPMDLGAGLDSLCAKAVPRNALAHFVIPLKIRRRRLSSLPPRPSPRL